MEISIYQRKKKHAMKIVQIILISNILNWMMEKRYVLIAVVLDILKIQIPVKSVQIIVLHVIMIMNVEVVKVFLYLTQVKFCCIMKNYSSVKPNMNVSKIQVTKLTKSIKDAINAKQIVKYAIQTYISMKTNVEQIVPIL